MKACLLLLCSLLANPVAAQTHLTPSTGYFSTHGDENVYYRLVRENLFVGLNDRPMVRVIVFPSFSPEYLVAVEKDHLEYYLIFRTCSESIWNSRIQQKRLTLIEKKTEISKELAQSLNEFLFVTISQAQYPPIEYITFNDQKPTMAFPIWLDGIKYRFIASMQGSDITSGETHSPIEGSIMAHLVNVVELMVSVAKGVGKETNLVASVEKLRKQMDKK